MCSANGNPNCLPQREDTLLSIPTSSSHSATCLPKTFQSSSQTLNKIVNPSTILDAAFLPRGRWNGQRRPSAPQLPLVQNVWRQVSLSMNWIFQFHSAVIQETGFACCAKA